MEICTRRTNIDISRGVSRLLEDQYKLKINMTCSPLKMVNIFILKGQQEFDI